MITIRPFHNADPVHVLDIWSEKANAMPELFSPLNNGILEEQLFGNILFDYPGFLMALHDNDPVGYLHTTILPEFLSDASHKTGLIFPPILRPSCPHPQEVATQLIQKAEEYFRSKNVNVFLSTNGSVGGFPFYDIMFGTSNPNDLLGENLSLEEIFLKLNYERYNKIRRFQLNVSRYQPVFSERTVEVSRQFIIHRLPMWITHNWWDAFSYRNFFSQEWNVYHRNDQHLYPKPIAGTVMQQLPFSLNYRYYILSIIGVEKNFLRSGIGSFLLSTVVSELKHSSLTPALIETSIEESDERQIAFFTHHCFDEIHPFTSFRKLA